LKKEPTPKHNPHSKKMAKGNVSFTNGVRLKRKKSFSASAEGGGGAERLRSVIKKISNNTNQKRSRKGQYSHVGVAQKYETSYHK